MTVLEAATPSERKKLMKVLGLSKERLMPRKYNNKVTYADGHRFDSHGEYGRWLQLKAREEKGEISELRVHPKYELRAYPYCLEDGPKKVAKIIPDFEYWENGKLVTEDFKGVITSTWRLKAKIFKANYGREIRVVRK